MALNNISNFNPFSGHGSINKKEEKFDSRFLNQFDSARSEKGILDFQNLNLKNLPNGTLLLHEYVPRSDYLDHVPPKQVKLCNNELSGLCRKKSEEQDLEASWRMVTILACSNNVLERIPACLESFEFLAELYLQKNRLAEVPSKWPSNLRILDISENEISSIEGLGASLLNLKIHHNKLTCLKFVEALVNLTELNASYNAVEECPVLFNHDQMVLLDISYNRIQNLNDSLFSMSKLKTLFLNGNKIADVVQMGQKGGYECVLEELFLRDNLLKEFPFSNLHQSCLCNVKTLDISENRTLETLTESFSSLENLLRLDARDCNLRSVPPCLGTLPLVKLYLSGNVIKSIPRTILDGNKAEPLLQLLRKRAVVPQDQSNKNCNARTCSSRSNTLDLTECEAWEEIVMQRKDVNNLVLKKCRLSKLDSVFCLPMDKHVTMLDVSCNMISVLPSSPCPWKLTTLNLSMNALTKIPQAFLAMPKLETLILADNKLSSFVVEKEMLPNLTTLDISNNSIKKLDARLALLPNLKALIASGNLDRKYVRVAHDSNEMLKQMRKTLGIGE